VNDRDDQGIGPHPHERSVVRAAAAAAPSTQTVSRDGGSKHDVDLGAVDGPSGGVDESEVAGIGDDRKEHPDATRRKHCQRGADVRFARERGVTRHHRRSGQFRDGKEGGTALRISLGVGRSLAPRGQQGAS
jgi:hypothetical protein